MPASSSPSAPSAPPTLSIGPSATTRSATISATLQQQLDEALLEQQQLRTQLEQLQLGLQQSGKLAGLGQIAAGVAHEINNPLAYVRSNLTTLGSYVQELVQIIEAMSHASSLESIRDIQCAMDYENIRTDITPLLDETTAGVNRIHHIVSLLKDFSHPGDDRKQSVQLHQILDNTLQVANNELRYKATVRKAYTEPLPYVTCDPTRIQQVVLNLVLNAVQAISQQGTIVLRTGHDTDSVWFEIEDDGVGMTPDTLEQLFEPFFTTKPTGHGTGLGLSVSRGIVRQHGGDIAVCSHLGQGSRFRVTLPKDFDKQHAS